MSNTTPAIQYTEAMDTEQEAREALAFWSTQVDYRCGRVLRAVGGAKPMLQAFFEDSPEWDGFLPDGCRRVALPKSLENTLKHGHLFAPKR